MRLNKFFICLVILVTSGFAQAGNESSGGGGVTLRPITVYEIQNEIPRTLKSLRYFMNYYEGDLYYVSNSSEVHNSLIKKLFAVPKQTIFSVLDSYEVEARLNDWCYDENHKQVDGSVYANRPHAICVSAFSLSKKLNTLNYRQELLGLVAHELSHIVGATEVEAQYIQEIVRNEVSGKHLSSNGCLGTNQKESLKRQDQYITKAIAAIQKNQVIHMCYNLNMVYSESLRDSSMRSNRTMQPIPEHDNILLNNSYLMKSLITMASICADSEDVMFKSLQNIFGNERELSLFAFLNRTGMKFTDPNLFGDVKVKNLLMSSNVNQDAVTELQEAQAAIQKLANLMPDDCSSGQ